MNAARSPQSDHTSHAAPVYLTSLPQELIRLVAEACQGEDLPSLRLVDRKISVAATPVFGHVRLAHRRFVLSEHSLQGAIDITSHLIFRKCLKSISIGTYRLNLNHEEMLKQREMHTEGKFPHGAAYAQALEGYWNKRSIFEESYVDLLKRVFLNLVKCGRGNGMVAIGIFDDVVKQTWDSKRKRHNMPKFEHVGHSALMDHRHMEDSAECIRKSYGWGQLYGGLVITKNDDAGVSTSELPRYWELRQAETMDIILSSFDNTTFVPRAFDLDIDYMPTNFTFGNGWKRHDFLEWQVSDYFSSLGISEEIDVQLKTYQHTITTTKSKGLATIQGLIPEGGMHVRDDIPRITQRDMSALNSWLFTGTWLQELHISNTTIDPLRLSELLRRNKKQLENLELHHVLLWIELDDAETWPVVECLRSIRDLKMLEHLSISNLGYTHYGYCSHYIVDRDDWQGRDQVLEGIDGLTCEIEMREDSFYYESISPWMIHANSYHQYGWF